MQFMDKNAKASAKRVIAAGRRSAKMRELEIESLASEYQGQDVEEFAALVRDRLHVAINRDYAAELMARKR